MESDPVKVLGFDPGVSNTGWALIESRRNELNLVDWGVIKVPSDREFQDNLGLFSSSIVSVINAFSPSIVAIESPVPRRSSLILGFVAGIIAGLSQNFSVREIVFINPSKEKKYGGKRGNRVVLKSLLGVDITSHHARDAAVVALVALDQMKSKNFCFFGE